MEKIVTLKKAYVIAEKLQQQKKNIVLAGGCFDILHIGHVLFLEKAKEQGDILLILLEHDNTIRRLKGSERPLNTQSNRAKILSSLRSTDYVIKLPEITDNNEYDKLVKTLKPAIIATTQGDSNRSHKERQAREINAKVIDVIESVKDQSTTRLIALLTKLGI